jgi:tetratricopeptide (TPR) repeat protein
MLPKSIAIAILLSAAAGAQQAQPPKPQPPKPPAAKQGRDLAVEEIDNRAAPSPTVSVPRSYAVVIGISKYPKLGPKQQLNFPERDASAMYSVLISSEGGNFKAENVHRLIGPQATLANIRKEIGEWLPSVAKEDDRVLIYFAGHGFIFDGKGYLAPYDVDPANGARTAYPMDELGSVIGSRIRAKSKILLTDACHSGAITPDQTMSLNRTLGNLNRSLFSLTASRDRESSYEREDLQHGIFTYFVVQGMSGSADENGDGVVTADELQDYVRVQVREATGALQNPTSERGSFDPQMFIALVPGSVKPSKPPSKTGNLVFVSDKDGVEVLVDGVSRGVVSKAQPLRVEGLPMGTHSVQGVLQGFEPDGPRDETVQPGEDQTVTLKLLIPRRRKKSASDAFDKGFRYYQKDGDYRKAVEEFRKALAEDDTYSQAALYLASSYNALFDEAKAQQYFRKAIQIDPDYMEARTRYAGMLLDIGDVDQALREIDTVLQRQPENDVALTMQAQAYRFKEMYKESIASAQQAIRAAPRKAEPHLWMGDSLRLSGRCAESRAAYNQYLKLSDFDSGAAGQLHYYVIGSLFGLGKRKHAAQRDIWKDLRSLTYFGICDCQKDKPAEVDSAVSYCQKALAYDQQDPFAHYALGVAFMYRFNRDSNAADLRPAWTHLKRVIELNPDLKEAGYAKQNLAQVESAMQQLGIPAR